MSRSSVIIALISVSFILAMVFAVVFEQRFKLQVRVNKGIGSTTHTQGLDLDN